nr:FAD-dependent oxidoreductase [Amycolatopsis sp. WAC 04182]
MAGHETDVVIVGAGLAGLAAALHLHRAGIACVVLEAGDDPWPPHCQSDSTKALT